MIKVARFWSSVSPAPKVPKLQEAGPVGLDAFASESPEPAEPAAVASGPQPAAVARQLAPVAAKWAAVMLVGAVVAAAGFFGYSRISRAAQPGTLTINTPQPGVEVFMGGVAVGRTPLTTSLKPGAYAVELRADRQRRTLQIDMKAGATIIQNVELGTAPPVAAAVGALAIHTEPDRLGVAVDGVERGVAPLTVSGLTPGEHQVTVRSSRGTLRRTVAVQPNETTSLIITALESTTPAAGWLKVTASAPLQLREAGRVIGTTESDRVMLTAGAHDIEIVSEALGFKTRKRVDVGVGATATLKIDLPNGLISINAQPWADVWLDGEKLGPTPIGNVARPIGTHEVTLRHPEFGERRESVVITVDKPARLGVDMRRK